MWLFTGVWSTYWRLYSERNPSLPLHEAKIDNSFLISGKTSCLLPISVLRFGLCCTCMYVLCMLSQLLCVPVQLPYCTRKILFACSPATTSDPYILLTPSFVMISEPWKEEVCYIGLTILQSFESQIVLKKRLMREWYIYDLVWLPQDPTRDLQVYVHIHDVSPLCYFYVVLYLWVFVS